MALPPLTSLCLASCLPPSTSCFQCDSLFHRLSSRRLRSWPTVSSPSLSTRLQAESTSSAPQPLFLYSRPEGPRTWVQKKHTAAASTTLSQPDDIQARKGTGNGNNEKARASPPSTSISTVSPPARRRKLEPLPITGYDAMAIEAKYDMRPLQVGWRLNSLGFPLLGKLLMTGIDQTCGVTFALLPKNSTLFAANCKTKAWYLRLLLDRAMGIDDRENIQRKRGEELRMHVIRSKSVALIKSGQAASLRPDLIRNPIWAEELGKLVDAVGAFSDVEAMQIMRNELADLAPRLKVVAKSNKFAKLKARSRKRKARTRLEKLVASDDVLSLFDFYNDNRAVASASIGQVYKARIRAGAQLEAAIGREAADRWGGKVVAIKVQRPDVEASASLDMYLLRRTATWLSKFRGGNLPQVADAFGMQLFGELDYIREANNCERFKALYGYWSDVVVPSACTALTRRRVLVMEWVDGEKGPWKGQDGIDMVRIGLRCSVDQLMTTGLFHSDPHRYATLVSEEALLLTFLSTVWLSSYCSCFKHPQFQGQSSTNS